MERSDCVENGKRALQIGIYIIVMNKRDETRIIWIDWMKVIGMYFIILGHFFPFGYTFIYVFNVPVFFIISGYLCQIEKSHLIFFRKILQRYIIPLMFISFAMFIWNWTKWEDNMKYTHSLYFLYSTLMGSQKCLGTGWFIYTLIIIRIIFQFSPSTNISHISQFFIFSLISIFLQYHNIHYFNAILNVSTAYPLFIIGHLLSRQKGIINNFHNIRLLLLSFVALFSIYICGKLNGDVWMYNNDYGKSYILFIGGALSGLTLLYVLSIMMERRFTGIIQTLSIGNIVTLGFHPIIVAAIEPQNDYLVYIISFVILISFYPVIQLARKYCPLLIGST